MNEATVIMTGNTEGVFDVAMFEARDWALFELTDARGAPLMFNGQVVSVELFGPGSEPYAKAQSRIDSAAQTRTYAALRGKSNKSAADENKALQVEKLTACTRKLNNFPIPGGAQKVYENPKLGFLTEQVAKLIEDWANFPPSSSTS